MKQLSGLDAAFLALESMHGVYGHVGSVCVLDPSTAPEPLTLARLTDVLGSRLHLVPALRRRLATVPFGLDQPYWVEDPHFDIEYHVRELALPAPGSNEQLEEQVARLHARPLDRQRPLWELYLISGLAGGQIAVYTKVHHAIIDGVSGNEIVAALLDLSPTGREIPPPPPWECDDIPGPVGLLARSALSLAGHPVRAAKLSLQLTRALPRLAGVVLPPVARALPVPIPGLQHPDRTGDGADGDIVLARAGLRAPATPWNRSITPHRRYALRTLSLTKVKQIKRLHAGAGVTVNDVVLALCAGALRSWLIEHDALPDAPLVVAVPVSVRTEAQRGDLGNRVSSMIAPLPTNLADPADRLRAVHEAMRAAKDQHGALPANLLADVTEFAMPALAGQAARLSARLRLVERLNPFNLIISNVPGPNVPLYYAGARLVAYYPVSAIADGQGLNITVMSYLDGLHFGLVACRELVPDIDRMAELLAVELDTLAALVPASA